MKYSVIYRIIMKILETIKRYYASSVLSKAIDSFVAAIDRSYKTSYMNRVLKSKRKIFEGSLFRKLIEFCLKIINVLIAFINRIFIKSKNSRSNEILKDVSQSSKFLTIFGRFILSYGLINLLISLVEGSRLFIIVSLLLAFIGIIFSSEKSFEYLRESIVYKFFNYCISFSSKEWN